MKKEIYIVTQKAYFDMESIYMVNVSAHDTLEAARKVLNKIPELEHYTCEHLGYKIISEKHVADVDYTIIYYNEISGMLKKLVYSIDRTSYYSGEDR